MNDLYRTCVIACNVEIHSTEQLISWILTASPEVIIIRRLIVSSGYAASAAPYQEYTVRERGRASSVIKVP